MIFNDTWGVFAPCKLITITIKCAYCSKIKRRRVSKSIAKKIRYCGKKCYRAEAKKRGQL